MLPQGLAINAGVHYRGSLSDLHIFTRNLEAHRVLVEKKEGEGDITDVGDYEGELPKQWAILFDKGYQGVLEDNYGQ